MKNLRIEIRKILYFIWCRIPAAMIH